MSRRASTARLPCRMRAKAGHSHGNGAGQGMFAGGL
jgi:hypothetical protein